MIRPILIGLNLIELNYYPFIISPDKCNENCNVVDAKHLSCDCKDTFNITTCNLVQRWKS